MHGMRSGFPFSPSFESLLFNFYLLLALKLSPNFSLSFFPDVAIQLAE